MSETPPYEELSVEREGGFWDTLRQPRIVLLLLGGWAVLGAVTEFFTSSGLFVDLRGVELDGALGGRALSWEQIPLALLYFYCARDPVRYHRVFWLALVEQVAAIAANLYHLGAGDFSAESVIIPMAGAAALGVLSLLNLFTPRESEREPSPV
jgi:hypothetical protein